MQLTEYRVVALILIATTWRSEIVIADEIGPTFIVQDLVKIVTSCYGDHIDAVGLAENVPDNLIRTLKEHLIPVVLIDHTRTVRDQPRRVPDKFLHKLPIFIVVVSSAVHLQNIIAANIQDSRWGNHMASYFILNDSAFDCRHIDARLYVAWRHSVINAKMICNHGGKTLIDSFNPFTTQAPVPWKAEDILKVRNVKNSFTWFSRYYRKNETICANLDFDKTTNLGGYNIHVHGKNLGAWKSRLNQTTALFAYNFLQINDRTLRNLFDVLHATPKFSSSHSENMLDMEAVPRGLNDQLSGAIRTYPHILSGYVIITQFRGHKSQLNKILSVIDVHSRFGVGVVYLITLIFLKFFVHQAIVPALLNLVRMTCNTGFTNLPSNTAARMFLTGLLFFVITIQGIYQGNLASLLTTVIPLRDVHTMQDLVDFGHEKIYGYGDITCINDHSYLREHYMAVGSPEDCISPVIKDSSAACIVMASGVPLDLAAKAKLHVGGQWVQMMYHSFIVRSFWPYTERVNKILSRILESSGLEPWDVKCNTAKFTDFQFDEDVMANVDFKNIELNEVIFAFVILGIGLVCATIIFIIELGVHRFQSRVKNVRVQILN